MLRISGLFLLLCGLLAPSTAQDRQGADGPSSPETSDLKGSLKEFLSNKIRSVRLSTTLTSGQRYSYHVRDIRIPYLSVENSEDDKNAKLQIAPEFTISVRIRRYPSINFRVRAVIAVDLQVDTSENGIKRITFTNCRLLPGSLEVVPENKEPSAPRSIAKEVEGHMNYTFQKDLAERMCSFLNTWFHHMRPRLTNEQIDRFLQPGIYV
ncbi:latherin-like [Saccopteryx leptura]|uniref:latherin-like n=1 Tax=Saccopteryx leptura TaxID=249018 RepID=UPI00339C67F7